MEINAFFDQRGKGRRFIESFYDGMRVSGVFLAKTKNTALTKNGKEYLNVVLQDRTGQIDAKVWDPNSPGIAEFEAMDYVSIEGNVTVYNGVNQLSIKCLRVAEEGSFDPGDCLPVSKRQPTEMIGELEAMISSVQEPHLKKMLEKLFIEDQALRKSFSSHSAAKSVHHGYLGGLMEHTLSVARVCDAFAGNYPFLNRDLLISAALCHDIGKTRELTSFPKNDYSDEGQLIGHIVIGYQLVMDRAKEVEGFPPVLASELGHCILAHHGELEYGSPKKPALMEAMALAFADNVDAKLETMKEALDAADRSGKSNDGDGWIGFNRLIDSNLRRTNGGE